MASLPESSTFDAGVYQLELTDPVIGGPSGVSNAPLKNLANRTKYLKDHVDALETSRAPLASPEFTGTPKVPTAATSTNTTQAASTAFVKNAIAAAAPDLSGYAAKESPQFTGNPTAPTAAIFDADTSLANTAFVQRALGNFRGVSGITDSVNADHIGTLFQPLDNATITVPKPSSIGVPLGATFTVWMGSRQSVTMQAAVGATFATDVGGITTMRLVAGQVITFVAASSDQWVINGYLPTDANFRASRSQNGYQKLPSGLIIQWGLHSIVAIAGTEQFTTLVYPISFPNGCYSLVISQPASYSYISDWGADAQGTTSSVVVHSYASNSGSNAMMHWIAIGN